MAQATFNDIIQQLRAYKRKYYLNKLARGSIYFGAVLLTVYLLFNSIEYTARLGSVGRAILFFSFLALFAFILVRWIILPLVRLVNNQRQLSDEEAARQIVAFFPEVKDKLLNILQLNRTAPLENYPCLDASIAQKTSQLSVVSFPSAINLRENVPYLKYVAVPAFFIFVLLLFVPQVFLRRYRAYC